MLKKNKVLILISILVLMLSVFALSACSNKTANKTKAKIYDANGLPLTKEAALKLWQGKWDDGKGQHFMNEIDDQGRISPLGFIKNGHVNRSFAKWEPKYNADTKTLEFSDPWVGEIVTYEFIDKNTFITNHLSNTKKKFTRVIE